MEIIETNSFTPEQREAIFHLWENEYPSQLAFTDYTHLDNYFGDFSGQRHLFAVDDAGIAGWAFTFIRERERWFAIIVDGRARNKRVGSTLIDALKQRVTSLNGWVTDHDRYTRTDGMPYVSPVGFYLKHGFTLHPTTRLETERLSAAKITWQQ